MDDIHLVIDRLSVTGLPLQDREGFVRQLELELHRALANRFEGLRDISLQSAELSEDVREVIVDTLRHMVEKQRKDRS